jgi:hypothetical protein
VKRILISTVVVGLAVAGIGTATAAPDFDKVTGGGQIIADMTPGPGDTIAFNAQETRASDDDDAARGQVQYVNRDGAGSSEDKFHGEVTCLQVMGNVARIGGVITNGEAGFFRIDLMDNGQGGTASDNDMIKLSRDTEPFTCDMSEEDDDDQMDLGRGNIQVHDAAE